MRRIVLAVAFVALGYAAVRPLWRCEYPPLTDLPEHALAISVLANLHDPEMRFDRSYEIDLFGRPTAVFYVTGAALAQVLPLRDAVKVAVAIAVLSVPVGLLLLLLAARKEPALALLGFAPVFGTLLHWGFVNYLLAAGLYLGVLGAIVWDLELPTRARAAVVVLASVLLFFTHVWGVLVLAVTAVPLVLVAARGSRAIVRGLATLVPCGLLSVGWWLFARPPVAQTGTSPRLALDVGRLGGFLGDLSGGLAGPGLTEAMRWGARGLAVLAAVALVDAFLKLVSARLPGLRRFVAGDARPLGRLDLALLLVPIVHLALYLVLPMDAFGWWFVYPREAFFVAVTLPAALPPLSLRPARILALLVAVAVAPWPSVEAGRRWPEHDRWTAGFDEVVARIPRGADVMSLVAATRAPGPFAPLLHLGAWAHALRGGRPAWSFAAFGATPVVHLAGRAPAPLPRRWEWTATSTFRLERHGRGWSHFLVGHAPVARLFRGHLGVDVEMVVQRRGWTYVRRTALNPRTPPGRRAPARHP